jgi:hypothetical protein
MNDVEVIRQWCSKHGYPEPSSDAVDGLLQGLCLQEIRRFLSVQYCDDIRYEVDGKTTLVGVYGTDLLVPSFPATLPKLCIRASAVTPLARPFESLRWIFTLNDDVLFERDFLASAAVPADDAALNGGTFGMHRVEGVFSPFELREPGLLRVVVETESGRIRGPGLRIGQATAPAQKN